MEEVTPGHFLTDNKAFLPNLWGFNLIFATD